MAGLPLHSAKVQLASFRHIFLDELIAELASYFPEGSLKNFDVFVPTDMPETEEDIQFLETKKSLNWLLSLEWNQRLVLMSGRFCLSASLNIQIGTDSIFRLY